MTPSLRRPGLVALSVAAALVAAGCASTPRVVTAQAPTPAQAPAAAAPTPMPATAPPANAADVASIDAILRALYDVISGPAGQRRNWDRMRSLFVPGARLMPTVRRADGTRAMRIWSVDEYITTVGPRLEEGGFFEREIARRAERFGSVAHVFSTYESRRAAGDPQPFARGINSIQLWFDSNRWWVVSIFWDSERPDNPIPGRYLQGEGGTPP
jgi:hypothetical protein